MLATRSQSGVGCMEQTGVLTQLIREATQNKGNLYGSLVRLNKCILFNGQIVEEETLMRYHLPNKVNLKHN